MGSSSARPRAVAVVGSPRPRSNTGALVDAALEELSRLGIQGEKWALGELRIAPCDGHDRCGERKACAHDDDAAALLDAVYAADVLILATPVYYENVSAQMKAFIDRNLFRYDHGEWLHATAVGLIAVTAETGLDETLAALRRYVALSTDGDVFIASLGGYADAQGAAAEDAALLDEARRLAAALAAAATG